MDILMIRRRNLYGILLRIILHLLWKSRHQKGGDLPADLQSAVSGKAPNGRKAFPRSDPQNEQYYPIELSRSQDKFYWNYLTGSSLSTSSILSSRNTFKKQWYCKLKKYSVYSTYVDEDERATGGSTILVQDNILHRYVNLNTDLHTSF